MSVTAPVSEAPPVVVEHVGLLVIPFLHEPDAGAASCVEELKGLKTDCRPRADGLRVNCGWPMVVYGWPVVVYGWPPRSSPDDTMVVPSWQRRKVGAIWVDQSAGPVLTPWPAA